MKENGMKHNQHGATLIITMIMLMLVTVLSLAIYRSGYFQERAAGNTRDRDVAFEGAENALSTAIARILDDEIPNTSFTAEGGDDGALYLGPPGGLLESEENNFWQGYDWEDASIIVEENDTTNRIENQQPSRYVVELYEIVCPGYTTKWPAAPVGGNAYRITARGYGRVAGTTIILQSWVGTACG